MNWVMYVHLRKYLDKINIVIISDDADIDIQQIFEYIKMNSIYYAIKTKSCIYIQRIFHSKRLISKNLIQK